MTNQCPGLIEAFDKQDCMVKQGFSKLFEVSILLILCVSDEDSSRNRPFSLF